MFRDFSYDGGSGGLAPLTAREHGDRALVDHGRSDGGPLASLDELNTLVARLEGAVADVAAFMAERELPASDAVSRTLVNLEQRLRAVRDKTHAATLAVVVRIGNVDAPCAEPPAGFNCWLAAEGGVTIAEANRDVRHAFLLGGQLADTNQALLAGHVSLAAAQLLMQIGAPTEVLRGALATDVDETRVKLGTDTEALVRAREIAGIPEGPITCEQYLLGFASLAPLSAFRAILRRFAFINQPEDFEAIEAECAEREHVDLTPDRGGWRLRGFLTLEHGEQLRLAVSAMVDRALNGVEVDNDVAADLPLGALRAQALADIARLATDTGFLGHGAPERRQILVHVPLNELDNRVNAKGEQLNLADLAPSAAITSDLSGLLHSEFSGGAGPVPPSLLRRIACDSEVTRVVFGPDSQVLNVGRTYRTVPNHLRKAVIARDRHCTYPGCDAPPERSEVHHAVTHWADGGETSIENSALLCWFHHTQVDTKGITMSWCAESKGWAFADKWGRPIKVQQLKPPPGISASTLTPTPEPAPWPGATADLRAANPESMAGLAAESHWAPPPTQSLSPAA